MFNSFNPRRGLRTSMLMDVSADAQFTTILDNGLSTSRFPHSLFCLQLDLLLTLSRLIDELTAHTTSTVPTHSPSQSQVTNSCH
jgi:hypothetical protein